MSAMHTVRKHLNNIEEYTCCLLLAAFVLLLFTQILVRQLFQYSIPWGDEVATYMFVWFAYLGAVVAAKMSAHNRVSFHFKFFPPVVRTVCEVSADMIWVAFNLYFVYLSYDFVFNKMNLFWKSQTTGIPMKYFYLILPIAFSLMTIRILWNNYERLFLGKEASDPETLQLKKLQQRQQHASRQAAAQ
ncbi:TRAP transporter small permease [Photobacterium atrarenae]|uniref:TRAP transporter small permease protein n=1 Tax=Photobacterium atrarenae TaxID=865757 RepID=A0ABY5GBM7_9GAMM|nr:TRAP transporter small permease [Photobacterium atrarenae]UTV26600.1 TRAP transporter small permease [Photobacterium atrarenae]